MKTICIGGVLILISAAGAGVYYLIKNFVGSNLNVVPEVEEIDEFNLQEIGDWLRSQDIPDFGSDYHIYVIKNLMIEDYKKINIPKEVAANYIRMDNTQLYAVVVSKGDEKRTVKSKVFIANKIETKLDVMLQEDVTELNIQF